MTDLYLGVGHGRRPDGTFDPGARGSDGRYEHYEATQVVAEAIQGLTRSGVSLVHEDHGSGGPEDPNYIGTVNEVNAGNFDIAVEVHFDWLKAPRGGFGHWISDSGKEIADAVYRSWENAGLPTRPDWHKRRTDLWFLRGTEPPAMLWECDRVQDYGPRMNEKMGEALAAGICDVLGKRYIPQNQNKPHYDVAVIGIGDLDDILAYQLGKRHGFKHVTPEELPSVDVDYLIKVGGAARRQYKDRAGRVFAGDNRYETADRVLARILGPRVDDRKTPWSG